MQETKPRGMLCEGARVVDSDAATGRNELSSTATSSFSSTSPEAEAEEVAEAGVSRSALVARKRAYDRTYSGVGCRLRELWGAEEPYAPTAESAATWAQRLYYAWIWKHIHLAAKEELRVEDLPPPRRPDRAHECGLKLSAVTQRSLRRRHGWSVLLGMTVRSRRDRRSRGALRWVGVPQSGGYRDVMAAVTWVTPPSHRVAECSAEYSPFFRGLVHGETLFAPEATDNSTLEEPCSLEFVAADGEDAALAASIPEPKRVSVVRDLLAALPGAVLWQFPGKIIGDICTLTIPVLLRRYVVYLTGDSPSWSAGLLLVMALFVVQATQSVALHAFYYASINGGQCFRSALTAVIFEKCFVISSRSLAIPEMSTGRIINMVSTDVERANDFLQFCMYLWSSPTVFIVSIVLLYQLVGWSALVAVVTLSTTLPLNALVMRRMMRLRKRLAATTDARVKVTNEFFSGVRIAKFMTWEPCFIADIEAKRETELHYLRGVQWCRVLVSFLNNAAPPVMIATVLLLYYFLGHELTPEIVFPAISLFAIIRMPFMLIPMTFNYGVQFIVSMARISAFLECENSQHSVVDIRFHNTAQRASGESGCELAALFENTDITAFVPVKLPRAPRVVLSLVARFMQRFCCCSACYPARRLHSPAWVQQPLGGSATPTTAGENDTKEGWSAATDALAEDRFESVARDILRGVSIEVPKGKLTVIIGPTGSGKSTLLAALLGEYEVTRGRVWATRSIAYVPQQPWIMNATLRENILFFAAEDPGRLREAVRVCQLEPDLRLLAGGMQTEIGEKGINLSGGQKARVGLARAVYADRELYLLDDPLSALDAHVGEQVVRDVLLGRLAHKTRVLVTHQLHLLPQADTVVVMGDGAVRFAGGREEFMGSPLYAEVLADDARQQQQQRQEEAKKAEEVSDILDGAPVADSGVALGAAAPGGTGATMMTVEEKAVGSVPWSTYVAYFRACGGVPAVAAVLLLFLLTEMLSLSSNVWLSMWSTRRFGLSPGTYLQLYIALVVCGAVTTPLRFGAAYNAMRRGSRSLHRLILRSVATGTMQFFDTTPLGRIVNRFSRDIDRLDDQLQMTFIFFLEVLYGIVSSFAVTVGSQPYVIVALLPTVFLYYKLIFFYSVTNREIRRIGSIVKAPMVSLLGEVLVGSSTIGAYGSAASVLRESLRRIDRVYASSFLENATNRWLGVRVDFLGNVIVVSIALLGVVGTMLRLGTHDIGLVSLSLTMAMASTSQLNWLARMVGSMEADMNSVERILYYAHNIDHEAMPELDGLVDELREGKAAGGDATATVLVEAVGDGGEARHPEAAAGWLELREVSIRYRVGLPLVLDKVSFLIESRQKVGVVGRTGSGKSTLLLAFMRMVDICGGDIVVSGRPIRAYGLRELRRQFSMIPQDPVLFGGTVQSNLDPFLESTPEEVWGALEMVGMRERVASESGGIYSRVQEGGSNYSVGQRQLLCLARALLRRGSGFILMDEATANIDHTLDRQIQHTVMTAFNSRTVITIAHRLHTVAAYDKIIVMDHGHVAESGSPRELVSDPSSMFFGLVAALGRQGAAAFMASVGLPAAL
ncbi:multidrug resistance protein A [Trypanosoma rangeli SC58]|uniref:Multidrug resistance protein A n=1 Tax=Trypanosoma rangeli SC58 TaxID=429131 RepID=A0A061IUH2_TRYRA|nr:multidrug resistance protein A [Trypanosoma rangeli SC58]